jgi:hypothetical protein
MPYVILYCHHIHLTHVCPFHFDPFPAGKAMKGPSTYSPAVFPPRYIGICVDLSVRQIAAFIDLSQQPLASLSPGHSLTP